MSFCNAHISPYRHHYYISTYTRYPQSPQIAGFKQNTFLSTHTHRERTYTHIHAHTTDTHTNYTQLSVSITVKHRNNIAAPMCCISNECQLMSSERKGSVVEESKNPCDQVGGYGVYTYRLFIVFWEQPILFLKL